MECLLISKKLLKVYSAAFNPKKCIENMQLNAPHSAADRGGITAGRKLLSGHRYWNDRPFEVEAARTKLLRNAT